MKGHKSHRDTSKQKQKFCLPSVPKYLPLDEKIENSHKVVDDETVRLFELSKLHTGLGGGSSSRAVNKANIFSNKFDKQKNNKRDYSNINNNKQLSSSHNRFNSLSKNHVITEHMRTEMELIKDLMDVDEDKKIKFIKKKKLQKSMDRDNEYRMLREKYNRKKENYFAVKIKRRLNSVCWYKSRGHVNLNLVIPAKKQTPSGGLLFLTGAKLSSNSVHNIFSDNKKLRGCRKKDKILPKAKSLSSLYDKTENPGKINSLYFQLMIYYEKQKRNILAKNLQKEKEEKLKIIKERKIKDKYFNPALTATHENPWVFKKINSLHKGGGNVRFFSPLKDQELSKITTQTISDQKNNRENKEESYLNKAKYNSSKNTNFNFFTTNKCNQGEDSIKPKKSESQMTLYKGFKSNLNLTNNQTKYKLSNTFRNSSNINSIQTQNFNNTFQSNLSPSASPIKPMKKDSKFSQYSQSEKHAGRSFMLEKDNTRPSTNYMATKLDFFKPELGKPLKPGSSPNLIKSETNSVIRENFSANNTYQQTMYSNLKSFYSFKPPQNKSSNLSVFKAKNYEKNILKECNKTSVIANDMHKEMGSTFQKLNNCAEKSNSVYQKFAEPIDEVQQDIIQESLKFKSVKRLFIHPNGDNRHRQYISEDDCNIINQSKKIDLLNDNLAFKQRNLIFNRFDAKIERNEIINFKPDVKREINHLDYIQTYKREKSTYNFNQICMYVSNIKKKNHFMKKKVDTLVKFYNSGTSMNLKEKICHINN
jgi:hypothetical protein